MSLLDARDLAMMRADQADALWDTCVVQTQSVTADTYGQPIETFTDGAAISCRFVPSQGTEIWRSNSVITRIGAKVRLPLGTAITPKDRVKITHRFGVALTTPLVFGVDDVGAMGPTCFTVNLMDVD